jgi:hypothetical protein
MSMGSSMSIAGPTLLTLPAELQQQIISNTKTITYGFPYRDPSTEWPPQAAQVSEFCLSIPFDGVCKLLQADIQEVLVQLPDSVLGPVDTRWKLRCLSFANRHFVERAEALTRTYSGFREIEIQIFEDRPESY